MMNGPEGIKPQKKVDLEVTDICPKCAEDVWNSIQKLKQERSEKKEK